MQYIKVNKPAGIKVVTFGNNNRHVTKKGNNHMIRYTIEFLITFAVIAVSTLVFAGIVAISQAF